jgi:uncharacterized protein (DUF2249 family)
MAQTTSRITQGPGTWRVAITRSGAGHANGSCCGSCGGGA